MARRVLAFLLATASPLLAADAPVEIYRRARAAEVRVGVVERRESRNVPIDTDEGTVFYPRVMRLDFFLEKRTDDGAAPAREAHGVAVLLLKLLPELERELDEELDEAFRALGADAFSSSYAGLQPGGAPWNGIGERSKDPSLACFLDGDSGELVAFQGNPTMGPDGAWRSSRVTVRSSSLTDESKEFCHAASAALDAAAPETISSFPVPTTLVETSVRVEVADDLQREAYAEALTPLPAGSVHTFAKREEGGSSSEVSSSNDNSSYEDIRNSGKTSERTLTLPAPVDTGAVGRNSWLSRWTVETVERRLGPAPSTRVLERRQLTLSLLPSNLVDREGKVVQPMETHARHPRPIRFDGKPFLERVGKALDRENVIDTDTLERLLCAAPAEIPGDGWIEVVCREGGTALYGLPPAGAHVVVTNAGDFCSRVATRLER